MVPQHLQQVPDDGYSWQDQEQLMRLTTPQNPQAGLEVMFREQGYKQNDQVTSIQRRRYRLINGRHQLQFIHYSVSGKRAPVVRHTDSPQRQQPSPFAVNPTTHGNIKKTVTSQQDADTFKFVGDEMDMLTVRDISAVRYKRNHQYLAELLESSTPVSEIVAENNSIVFGKDPKAFAELQKARKSQLEHEIEQMQAVHRERLKKIRDSSKKVFNAISSVSQLKTIEDCDQSVRELAESMHLKAIPHAPIMRLHKSHNANNSVEAGEDSRIADITISELFA